MPKIGVIGGSGLYDIPGLARLGEEAVKTPYGEPSGRYLIAGAGTVEVAFLPRHGARHDIAPHKVNYRANIWGMKSLGVERILGINAAGGIDPGLAPGSLVITDQIMDFTLGARESTFYDGKEVIHVDFTDPYCPELRGALLEAARQRGIAAVSGGTYVCTNGPRLETRAEIAFFGRAGGHVVGMTGMPEAALARELELCYSSMAVVTNAAAGVSGASRLSAREVMEMMALRMESIKKLLQAVFALIPAQRQCCCKDALKDSRL
ncbi:MAG: S-methyl-5'-thioadenosine phosphorylase [Nitrospiraceae bacterium]|nr:S-methyl-5'-thioadenosine phosphorylase [Nitrospiraceae bacterium]